MANYFRKFPAIPYRFGDETSFALFDNLSIYNDLIDQVSDEITFYQYYNILDGDRPDTLSYKLYGNTKYHWTFYLLNDQLRESGWPLTEQEVSTALVKHFPGWAITSNCKDLEGIKLNGTDADDSIGGLFTVGQSIIGYSTSHTGTIINRQIDIGQFIIQSDNANPFASDDYIYYNDDEGQQQFLRKLSITQEYNGVHHYEDSNGNWVDVDPFEITTRTPSGLVTKTFEDNFRDRNDELKKIKVLRSDSIEKVVNEYFRLLV